jgi:hypothetical protein
VSCHGLIYAAYGSAGVHFPHRVATMPWFNPARWTGHPFGHPAEEVNVEYVYLRDHHIYNDDRFEVVLQVRRHNGEVVLSHRPGKYSWQRQVHDIEPLSNVS